MLIITLALLAPACTAPAQPVVVYVETPVIPDSPEMPAATPEIEPIEEEPLMLKPIPIFPAYIRDQCFALWGIPVSLKGETHKVKINIETVEGDPVPQSELDFYTLEGAIYLVHSRVLSDGKIALDTYRQVGNEISLDDTPPAKPAESRATLDSPQWLIESVVVNGIERSDLYNRNPVNGVPPSGKGRGPIVRSKITSYAIVDNGLVYMTTAGSEFLPCNRMSVNAVSEYGRLWRLN